MSETKAIDETLRENIAAETAAATAAAKVNEETMLYALAKTLDQLEPKVEAFEVPSTRQFFSLAYVCQCFQVAPPVARELMKRAGVTFTAAVNDIGYVDGDSLVAMNRYLRQHRAEREAKQ
jgi:hypothetical protein